MSGTLCWHVFNERERFINCELVKWAKIILTKFLLNDGSVCTTDSAHTSQCLFENKARLICEEKEKKKNLLFVASVNFPHVKMKMIFFSSLKVIKKSWLYFKQTSFLAVLEEFFIFFTSMIVHAHNKQFHEVTQQLSHIINTKRKFIYFRKKMSGKNSLLMLKTICRHIFRYKIFLNFPYIFVFLLVSQRRISIKIRRHRWISSSLTLFLDFYNCLQCSNWLLNIISRFLMALSLLLMNFFSHKIK